jgi:hypothetical protein
MERLDVIAQMFCQLRLRWRAPQLR